MCLLVRELCPLCEQTTGAEFFLQRCFESQIKAGCQELEVRREFALPEHLPTVQCKTEDCLMNKGAMFKCEDSWRATVEKGVEEESISLEVVSEVANVPEPMGTDKEETAVAEPLSTNLTPVNESISQPKTSRSVNMGTHFTPINKSNPSSVPVESVPSASSGESKAKRKAVDDGNRDMKRVETGDKPSRIITLSLPEGRAQILGAAPANAPAPVVAAPPPAVVASSPVVVARPPAVVAASPVVAAPPAAVVVPAASKGPAKIVQLATAELSLPPTPAPVGQPSQPQKVKIQYRSAGKVNLEDLDDDVIAEIRALQTKMNERIAQNQFQKRTIPWLLEEDNLLQVLRLQGFAFTQISREYLTRRSMASCTLRRSNQKTKHAKGFVHIPDGPEEEEIEEAAVAETSAAGAAKGKARESSAKTQTVQTKVDLYPVFRARLEQGQVEAQPQAQPQARITQGSGVPAGLSAASSVAGANNGNGSSPARPLPRIVVKPWGGARTAQTVQLPLADPVPIGQVPAQLLPRPQAEPKMGVFSTPPAPQRSTGGDTDVKGKGKAPASPVAIEDNVQPSASVTVAKPESKPKGKGKRREKVIPDYSLVEDDESDCSDSDIQARPCVPECKGPMHFCSNYLR